MTRNFFNALLPCAIALLLVACGNSGAPDSTTGTSTSPASSAAAAKLAKFQGENICDLVAPAVIEELFSPQAPVEKEAKTNNRRVSCEYSWERPDAEERREAMMDAMMKSMQAGSGVKFNARQFLTDFSFSVDIKEAKATPATFVPRTLTEQEIQDMAEKAARRAEEKLTDTQKQVLGEGGTKSMTESMLRSANKRTRIEGVGDAAYWAPIAGGSLNILVGNRELSISPQIADDESGNIEAAKKIFAAITR